MLNRLGAHISKPLLLESVFSLLFCPTTPILFDSSGIMSSFLKTVLVTDAKDMFADFKFAIARTTKQVISDEKKKPKPIENLMSDSMDTDDNDNEPDQHNDVI